MSERSIFISGAIENFASKGGLDIIMANGAGHPCAQTSAQMLLSLYYEITFC